MRWVIENVDGQVHPVLHMYDIESRETFHHFEAVSAVAKIDDVHVAFVVPTPEAIHPVQ